MIFMYKIGWYDDFCESDKNDKGIVLADSIMEAQQRVIDDVMGSNKSINLNSLYLEPVELENFYTISLDDTLYELFNKSNFEATIRLNKERN